MSQWDCFFFYYSRIQSLWPMGPTLTANASQWLSGAVSLLQQDTTMFIFFYIWIYNIYLELIRFGGFGWLDCQWFWTSYIYGLKNVYTCYLITFSTFHSFCSFFTFLFLDKPRKHLTFSESIPMFFFSFYFQDFLHFFTCTTPKKEIVLFLM